MTFNGLIKKIKEQRMDGVKQKNIAYNSNIDPCRLSQIVCKRVEPSKKELEKLAKYFNCSISELIEF